MDDTTRRAVLERAEKLMFLSLDDQHLEAARTGSGGWSKAQLALIGVDWPPAKGWMGRVKGTRLPGSVVAAFIRLRKQPEPSLFDAEQRAGQ